jgi:hypothetical protein
VTTSAASSYHSGPCELPLPGQTTGRPGAAGSGGHRPRRDLEPIMEQAGGQEIRERHAGITRRLRPGRGGRPPVPSHQPEPGNEEERA